MKATYTELLNLQQYTLLDGARVSLLVEFWACRPVGAYHYITTLKYTNPEGTHRMEECSIVFEEGLETSSSVVAQQLTTALELGIHPPEPSRLEEVPEAVQIGQRAALGVQAAIAVAAEDRVNLFLTGVRDMHRESRPNCSCATCRVEED